MENNEEVKLKKMNFFQKIKYSVTDFEEYPYMAAEGVWSAIRYLIGITAIFVIVISICIVYNAINIIKEKLINEFPEIKYSNNQLDVNSNTPIKINEKKIDLIQEIIIDTKIENEEEINGYIENMNKGIILLKDKIILVNKTSEIKSVERTYSDFITDMGLNVTEFNKQDILEYISSPKIYLILSLVMFINLIVMYFITFLIDSITLSLLGLITTIFAGLRLKYSALFNMSVYSLTLSIILNMIYIIANCFLKITIEYFQVAYIGIAYVYLIAVIFIIKSDFIKKQAELMKIIEEQRQKNQRIEINEEQKDNTENEEKQKEDEKSRDEEKKDENGKDNNLGGEPKGAET